MFTKTLQTEMLQELSAKTWLNVAWVLYSIQPGMTRKMMDLFLESEKEIVRLMEQWRKTND